VQHVFFGLAAKHWLADSLDEAKDFGSPRPDLLLRTQWIGAVY
jgi:hypothetical protein